MVAAGPAGGPIVIVGVGALGSHVVLFLRSLGVPLEVIDFDRVEQKNTLAQLHGKSAVGKNKAVALQQLMVAVFGVKIGAVPHKLTGDNAAALLAKASLVVDCTDNGAARRAIQAEVRRLGVPCVHGALSADGAFARVVWDERFVADDASPDTGATCEDGARLPFFALAAAQVALAVQRYVESGVRTSVQLTATSLVTF